MHMQNNGTILRHGLIIISERNIGSAACKAINKKSDLAAIIRPQGLIAFYLITAHFSMP